MRSTYNEQDVILLLKDITGMVEPQPTEEREQLIQSGRHYCEMLPIEYVPTEKYMHIYQEALTNYAQATADAIGSLADRIMEVKGKAVVLVSLARAGIPIGILLKRYLFWKYQISVPHYSISIIRGKGIDHNAVSYILERHSAKDVLFVDGWIGKGAILGELKKEVDVYKDLSPELAVVADPANMTALYGTHEDLLIPSSCLNSTVSGLISRTFLRADIIGERDFHGAVFYENLIHEDLSEPFLHAIESRFQKHSPKDVKVLRHSGFEEVLAISKAFQVADCNFIKPGIGETTRVLLRRVPWKILIGQKYKNDIALAQIFRLAEEKNVPVEYYPLENYKACGIIKKLADV